MGQQIKDLMSKPPPHDSQWLGDALQAAVELELSTLPPYLCGQWALQDQNSEPAKWIQEIAIEEMSHLGLACNLLTAVGRQPQILSAYLHNIKYPGPLPGGVRPKPNPTYFPFLSSDIQVELGFKDFTSFARMCMYIEYPEDPILPLPLVAFEGETFPSIGQFYNAVLNAFQQNDRDLPYETRNQVAFSFNGIELFPVKSLQEAKEAISRIQKQGEGTHQSPFEDPGGELAHFYRFGKIYFKKEYVFDPVPQKGWWTGNNVSIPNAYEMTPVPPGGYGSNAPSQVLEIDKLFTQMLQQLDQAWVSGGNPTALNPAIRSMKMLGMKGIALLQQQIRRPDSGIYGPQFRAIP